MSKKILVAALAALIPASANAACFGSDDFQTCNDTNGNSYTTMRSGDMSWTNDRNSRNSRTGSSWSQNSMDLSDMTVTNARAANGHSWHMNQMDLGGGMSRYSRTDSNGNAFSGTCTQFGCN